MAPTSKIVIISQAPGRVVHENGVPWQDKSGNNLRRWLGVDNDVFYNTANFAILPMGFCFPGTGKSGDLPPRKECAPQWHSLLRPQLHSVQLTLLVGQYAQKYYLKDQREKNLTETVRNFGRYLPAFFPLPHPSPRNNIWQKKNAWFLREVLPELGRRVNEILY
ncbi:MAG: uracil-DNA glycosylase family protein [Bacteroidota bacterium]